MKMIYGMVFGGVLFLGVVCVAHAAPLSAPEKYQDGKTVKILIVPGHDDEFSGASFRGMREADMTLALAKQIRDDLVSDSNIAVTLSREGSMYTPELTDYFSHEAKSIANFIARHSQETKRAIASGDIAVADQVPHANANTTVVTRLYGINKWATEQDFDLILHIHFNDYWPRTPDVLQNYFGYTVYVPDAQLSNAAAAKPFGIAIAQRLSKIFPRSTMPLEQKQSNVFGVAPDLKLIALGANRTLEIPSILVEYAYGYEPQVAVQFFAQTKDVYARATATGIVEYLSGIPSPAHTLQYHFDTDLSSSQSAKSDALMLQLTLAEAGLYPPSGKTAKDCPFTGRFGPCTKSAVMAFQKKFYLDPDGLFGKRTRAAMNGVTQIPSYNSTSNR